MVFLSVTPCDVFVGGTLRGICFSVSSFEAHRNSFRWGPLYIDIGLEQLEAANVPRVMT